MNHGDDRKAYDQLVLDNMDGINSRLDKFMTDQTAHNLEVAQRVSVVETKAMLLGGLLGTLGGQLVELIKQLMNK